MLVEMISDSARAFVSARFFAMSFVLLACAETPKNDGAGQLQTPNNQPTILAKENTQIGTPDTIQNRESGESQPARADAKPNPTLSSAPVSNDAKPMSLTKPTKRESVQGSQVPSTVPGSQSETKSDTTPQMPAATEKQSADVPMQHPPTSNPAPAEKTAKLPLAPSHEAWNELLGKYVSATGNVSYKGFKSDKATLETYLNTLSDNMPQDEWTREEKMAYWINAYNAFTIKLIVDNYPLESILKLDNGKTWDVKRIALGGKKYSLNQIENDILRPKFKDARIHFALNCAAKSCPPLLNKAFTAENLDATLDQQTRKFINNAQFNQISAEKATVSKIFEWYAADFGNIRNYLNRYAKTKLKEGASIAHSEYNWDLNE